MNKKQSLQAMALLETAYPGFNVPKVTAELYIDYLQTIDLETAKQAIRRVIQTSKFFPTIAEIRENVVKVSPQLLPQSDQAWLEVMQQLSDAGYYKQPKWSCDAVKDAVKAIGWTTLCRSENIAIERAHFLKIYDGISNRYKDDQVNREVLSLISAAGMKTITGGMN